MLTSVDQKYCQTWSILRRNWRTCLLYGMTCDAVTVPGKSGILRITHATQVRGWLRQAWHPKTVHNGSYQTKGPKNPLTWPSCEISWRGKDSAQPSKPLSLVCLLFLSNICAPFQSIPNWPVAIEMTGTHAIQWLTREAAVLLLLTHRPCLVAIVRAMLGFPNC